MQHLGTVSLDRRGWGAKMSTFEEELLAVSEELRTFDGDGGDGEGSASKACCQYSSKN
jgi:hypothetical protein